MKNIILRSLLLVLIIIQSCTHQKSNTTASLADAISTRDSLLIDSLFIDFSKNKPGAAILIAKGDHVIYKKGFGLINLKTKKPVDENSHFYLASASKQFTAIAILKLIDQGKLTFESTLTDVFPDFPDYGKSITIQHLLTHQSGLPEINRIKGASITDHNRLKELYKIDSLLFSPGTRCEYNNTAYSVLAEIVAAISGLPFDRYMQKHVFSVIGMDSTTYYKHSNRQNVGYRFVKDSILSAPGVRDAAMGSGSVYTSINDYFKWHMALNNYRLVSRALQLKSYQPQKGAKNNWGYYGYGWYALENDAYTYVEHGGVSQSTGFICFTARIPKENITVAIFTNRAWSGDNLPSQNIGNRIKTLLHIATKGKFPRPKVIDPIPKKSLAQAFADKLLSKGIKAAQELVKQEQHAERYYIEEKEFNQVGYYLLDQKRVVEAIAVFRMNAALFPNSWNAFDSLAEAYLINGNKVQALVYYKKSVALNSKNKQAIQHIKELEQQQ